MTNTTKQLVVGGGCFWGLEDLIRTQTGVIDTEVGYAGGTNGNPTYENHPGHAEVVQITYDTNQTSFKKLLAYFFRIHNPTTPNQQGNDIGTSYRSVIFYTDETEKKEAEEVISLVNASGLYTDPVVTQVVPAVPFYSAEEYHQDYLQKHPGGYTCHFERGDKGFLG